MSQLELTTHVKDILLEQLKDYSEYSNVDIINQEVSGLVQTHDLVIGVEDSDGVEFFVEVNVVEA